VQVAYGQASRAAIQITLALYDNALGRRVLGRIEEVARGIVEAAGGSLAISADYALPALINDDNVTCALERAAVRVVGGENILKNRRNRFADDFVLVSTAAPGA